MVSSAVLIAIVVILALEILFQLLVLKFALPIFESRPLIGAELYPPVPDAEPLAIPTPDGLQLAGSLFRTSHDAPRGIILFCHEFDSNRWSASYYCEGLLASGFDVLAIDFRNQGDSDSLPGYSPMHWPTHHEVADVCATVAFIERHPELKDLPLGIYGMSRGGSIGLAAAARCPRVRCVAADGAYGCSEMLLHFTNRWGRLYFPDALLRLLPRWHIEISLWLIRRASEFRKGHLYAGVEQALSSLRRRPVLMISGERDNYVHPEITMALHARTGQDESGTWIVPDAKHNMARDIDRVEYDRRLVDFFSVLDSADLPAPAAGGDLRLPVTSSSYSPG
jgi:uncharacterized protein